MGTGGGGDAASSAVIVSVMVTVFVAVVRPCVMWKLATLPMAPICAIRSLSSPCLISVGRAWSMAPMLLMALVAMKLDISSMTSSVSWVAKGSITTCECRCVGLVAMVGSVGEWYRL